MTKLNSVFRDEIKMHLSVREAELSHEVKCYNKVVTKVANKIY